MTYEAFSRKYRPRSFSEVVGQEYVVKTLKNALRLNRISHAYIFSGQRGVGKTTIARILTKALNCKNPVDFEPCNQCENCIEIEKGSFPDMYEIDAASNRGIDDIRSIRDNVGYSPIKGNYKVYIIDEVHMLTKEAFNALLKTLEEPPPKNIFILATTELYKIPDTIKSRCQIFIFKQPTKSQIKHYLESILKRENLPYEEEAVDLLVEEFEGGMRDFASLLDQAVTFSDGKLTVSSVEELLGIIPKSYIKQTLQHIKNSDLKEAVKLIDIIETQGYDLNIFWKQLIDKLHHELLSITLNQKGDIFSQEDEKKVIYILSLFNKAFIESKTLQNPKSVYQLYILKLKFLEYIKPVEQLIKEGIEITSISKQTENKTTEITEKTENVEPDIKQKIIKMMMSEPMLSVSLNQINIEEIEDKVILKTENLSVAALLEKKIDEIKKVIGKDVLLNTPKIEEKPTKKSKKRDNSIDKVLELFPGSKILKYEDKEE
ncbi:MAG: DNA polymerase III subunit gamma/tau [Hydrogenothermaceae bacterium]|nr:DNA polymerase III subunit gamma/tau [Hydrogenothermaceae bacterium]